ncbi:hypothetical protein [Mesorhizobium sp. 131-2-1]|uniref:hypothetical protein n=1 Tax=Mesorhizobium sp. 131-2-1 TaxID=2744518 RepID=UPI0019293AC9|nr:hypothetical protein [Mesorhizobium sp. 131-2-1]BCG94629.1 hypothetical protein MesoLj131a_34930 [Mesorhizobium sp. 131-2-1]
MQVLDPALHLEVEVNFSYYYVGWGVVAVKVVIRAIEDAANLIAVAAMLLVLLPFLALDKAEQATRWARQKK